MNEVSIGSDHSPIIMSLDRPAPRRKCGLSTPSVKRWFDMLGTKAMGGPTGANYGRDSEIDEEA